MTPFVHLRLHSAYSLCEGAVKIQELAKACIHRNQPAVALTDTNNMFGVLDFSMKCSSCGIQPISGTTIDLKYGDTIAPIVLLAKNEAGYLNLMKLMTCFYMENHEERKFVTVDNLKKYSEGIIALSGGWNGVAGSLMLSGKNDIAAICLNDLKDIYKDNFYIEISRTGEGGEKRTEQFFVDYAFAQNVPLVATNDVFFLDKDMHPAHDALLCIADGTYLTVKDRRRVTSEHYLKTTDEMFELFSDIKEAVLNTSLIAQRCSYMPEKRKPRLPSFVDENGESNENDELDRQAHDGFNKRLENEILKYKTNQGKDRSEVAQEYLDRLHYELSVIKKMGFSGYFLVVSDFVKWTKNNGIPVGPGRGSGAGSLVAWCLSITDLDPIRYHLLFERFLNPERVSMPDFDIDFCQERRDEVIKYVQSKYGANCVAHIIALGKLQARVVIRDVGRVMQLPYGQVDKISKLVPQNPTNPVDLAQALEIEPQLRQMMQEDETIDFLIKTALQLEGLYRQASMHAAGIVISDKPVDEMVPVYSDGETELAITQFNMKFAEMAGLVKFDFLGLKTLTVIKKTCDYIKQYRGIDLDISKIDIEDKETFKTICAADVIGVFQLESSGMRDVIQKLKPDNIEDIIALVSLYRPGPMDNIPLYIARKHGLEKTEYLHPLLEPILKSTYGIMIYQEQVMKTAQVMGGYSLAGADLLRRAMGKKIKEEMEKNRDIFTNGAEEKGISKITAHAVFALMEKFAGYGFNRSHAAAYALISYQTAYLKTHFRREFYMASMNIDITSTDKIATFVQDARACGIEILPPDINESDAFFKGEGDNAIRYALGALKGCSTTVSECIVNERKKQGKFKDIFDFFRRVMKESLINAKQADAFASSGTFDSIHGNRHQIMASLEQLLKSGETKPNVTQRSLFAEYKTENIALQNVKEWGDIEKLDNERKAIGFYLGTHPMDIYSEFLNRHNITRSKDFETTEGNITIAGVILSKKEKLSKGGQKFAFIMVSDQDNSFEVSVFPEAYAQSKEMLVVGTPLLIEAIIKRESESYRILATSVKSIDQMMNTKKIYISLDEDADIESIYRTIDSLTDGDVVISFLVKKHSGQKVEIETNYKKKLSIEDRHNIQRIQGVNIL